MPATLIIHEKRQIADGLFKEVKIWRVQPPVLGSAHPFKYSLALMAHGRCVLRYDNERGKGDHKHPHGDQREQNVTFVDLATLLAEFDREIDRWRRIHEHVTDSG